MLEKVNPDTAQDILAACPRSGRTRARRRAGEQPPVGAQPELPRGQHRPPDGAADRRVPPELTVGEAIEELRELVKRAFVTYGFVIDAQGGCWAWS